MQPTIEILDRIRKNSRDNKEEIFTRLYRYLLRPDLYYLAYKNLYANKGAGTKGVNDDTADGFSKGKVDRIIQSLADGTYTPNPVRRKYIQKKQNSTKKRPLGIPTFTDKLVQEVLRMILESVNLLKQFSRLSSQQELPHCAEIFEKRIFRCVVVY
jgi:RNA-directed DNA polymerase